MRPKHRATLFLALFHLMVMHVTSKHIPFKWYVRKCGFQANTYGQKHCSLDLMCLCLCVCVRVHVVFDVVDAVLSLSPLCLHETVQFTITQLKTTCDMMCSAQTNWHCTQFLMNYQTKIVARSFSHLTIHIECDWQWAMSIVTVRRSCVLVCIDNGTLFRNAVQSSVR